MTVTKNELSVTDLMNTINRLKKENKILQAKLETKENNLEEFTDASLTLEEKRIFSQ